MTEENELISLLQKFLLEQDAGFAFVERQQRIRTADGNHCIALVFYNYILKCFVLVDLKFNKLAHRDISQLDVYLRQYEEQKRGLDDNPTIGLILCSTREHCVAKYSVLNDSKQFYMSKYMTVLPSEEKLKRELTRARRLIENRIKENRIEERRRMYCVAV